MITQNEIAKIMKMSQTSVNFMLRGLRPVTWPQAEKLSELFPGKDLRGWKYAKPEEIKRAFNTLKAHESEESEVAA